MSENVKVGDSVRCIGWDDDWPYVASGVVDKINRQWIYVDGEPYRKSEWHKSVSDAFNAEYQRLFCKWNPLFLQKELSVWDMREGAIRVSKLLALHDELLLRSSARAYMRMGEKAHQIAVK